LKVTVLGGELLFFSDSFSFSPIGVSDTDTASEWDYLDSSASPPSARIESELD
jgi:hypothetical protein